MPLVRRLSRRLPPSLIQFRAHLPPLFNLCLSIHEMKAFSNFNYGLSPAGAPPKLGHNGEQLWGVGQRHFHRQLARGLLSSQVNIWQTYTWDIFYIYIYCASVLPQPKSSLCATTGGQVVQKVVMDSDSADSRLPLGTIPNCSMKEFWLPLTAFDVSARSKHGCRVVENVVCLEGA